VVKQRSMTKRDYEATVRRLTITERSQEIGRRVLVAGESQSAVAQEYKITVGAVSHQVGRIWKAYIEAQELPPGFERVCAILPADKAEIVRTWERDHRRTR
jgi:hypothetical protein